jgi:hypothetical protein
MDIRQNQCITAHTFAAISTLINTEQQYRKWLPKHCTGRRCRPGQRAQLILAYTGQSVPYPTYTAECEQQHTNDSTNENQPSPTLPTPGTEQSNSFPCTALR